MQTAHVTDLPSAPPRPWPRSPRVWLAALVALLALAAAAWRLRPAPAADDAPAAATHVFQPTAAQLSSLGIQTVQARAFRSVVRTEGSIAFDDEAATPVYSQYSGRVARVQGRLGDRVRAGEPLLVVAATEFAQGQSDLATARAVADTARAAERRQQQLFEAGAAAERDVLQAQSDRVAADAALGAARSRLRILGRSDAQIDAMERTPAGGAEATVAAPIAGTITQRAVGPGQYVQSAAAGASSPLFVIADLSSVWLMAYVREQETAQVRVGQPVEVRVPSLPGRTFTGRVDWIAAALDPATHRLAVRAKVGNPDGALKPQMFADAAITTSADSLAPAVPAAALVYDGEVTRLFVEAGGRIVGRPVRTGRDSDGYVEILQGLKAGERVVTAGTLFVDHAVAGD